MNISIDIEVEEVQELFQILNEKPGTATPKQPTERLCLALHDLNLFINENYNAILHTVNLVEHIPVHYKFKKLLDEYIKAFIEETTESKV